MAHALGAVFGCGLAFRGSSTSTSCAKHSPTDTDKVVGDTVILPRLKSRSNLATGVHPITESLLYDYISALSGSNELNMQFVTLKFQRQRIPAIR